MKEMWSRNKKDKLHLESEILFLVLALAVFLGLGAGTYTALGQTPAEPPPGKMRFFDPFTMTTIYVDARQGASNTNSSNDSGTPPPVIGAASSPVASYSGSQAAQPNVIVPERKPIRSPYRPPWVPGPPPWPPGPPPWV